MIFLLMLYVYKVLILLLMLYIKVLIFQIYSILNIKIIKKEQKIYKYIN